MKDLVDKRLRPSEIVGVDHERSTVKITLNNGVQVHISSNKNEVFMSFAFADKVDAKPIHANNNITITYEPYEGIPT